MATVREILDDAIAKERAARELYTQAVAKAQDVAAQAMLRELAEQEAAHEQALMSMSADELLETKIPSVPDLQISDYLVEKEITAESTFQDVLIYAMKREDESWKTYQALADSAEDPQCEQILARLAEEEKAHKNRLETLYDDIVYAQD